MNGIIFYFLFCMLLIAQSANVKISDRKSPNEVTIAINPLHPDTLIAGANLNSFYYSFDAGKTWMFRELSSQTGIYGDPAACFTNNGEILFANLTGFGDNDPLFLNGITVQKSAPNNISFSHLAIVGPNSPKEQDKEWITVDAGNSQYRGNVYLSWTEFDKYGSTNSNDKSRIKFSRSTDNGITWSNAITISDIEGGCLDDDNTAEGAVPAVGPNGEVYVAWANNNKIYFDKSLDGGVTFGSDKEVCTQLGGWDYPISGINRANGLPVTVCDISDNSNTRGNIYVNYTGENPSSVGQRDVFIVKSNDGGNTWSAPILVNNDATGREQFLTWACIDQTTGYLYIVYYDRSQTVGDFTDVFVAVSKDGGESFINKKISETSFLPSKNVFFGDYINIAARNGKIFPIWMRADNTSMSVWTALLDQSFFETSAINLQVNLPEAIKLKQNYPNPFNPSTIIEYDLPKSGIVSLKITDILGQKIKTLVSGFQTAGKHKAEFNADNLSSGIYFYTIIANGQRLTKKMLLNK